MNKKTEKKIIERLEKINQKLATHNIILAQKLNKLDEKGLYEE